MEISDRFLKMKHYIDRHPICHEVFIVRIKINVYSVDVPHFRCRSVVELYNVALRIPLFIFTPQFPCILL